MSEWKRVFTAPAFLASLLLLSALNVWLFVRASTHGYLAEEVGNADSAFRAAYQELLERYRSADCELAHEELSLLSHAEEIYEELDSLSALSAQIENMPDAKQYWKEMIAPKHEAVLIQYDALQTDWGDLLSDGNLSAYAEAAEKLDAQFVYLLDYPAYMQQIQENAKMLSETSIFNQTDSYSSRNGRKTAQDFLPLTEIRLQVGNDAAVTAFYSWRAGDYFLLLILSVMALLFRQENNQGPAALLWTTSNGRGRLALHRISIMLATAIAACLLLYGGVLMAGFALYGGTDELGRAAQSAALFRQYTHIDTLGSAVFRLFAVRIITAFELGLFIWLFISLFRSGTFRMVVCLVILLSAEYAAYIKLPSNSTWQLAKYMNLFTLIEVGSWLPGYHNLKLLTFPVGLQTTVVIQAAPASVLLGVGCVGLAAWRYPGVGGQFLPRLSARWDVLSTRALFSLQLFGQELWKLLVHQRGWAVVVSAIAVACTLPFSAQVSYEQADWVLLEYQGPVTEKTRQEISSNIHTYEEALDVFSHAEERYAAGEMEMGEYYELLTQAIYDRNNLEALTKAQEILQMVSIRCDELGIRPWLADQIPFESVYGESAARIRNLRSMILLLSACLLLHSFGAMECKRGLEELLRSTTEGRSRLVLCKFASASVCLACIWLPNMVGEVHNYLSLGGVEIMDAPIQALLPLLQIPLRCSFRDFLILYYCTQLVIFLFLGYIVLSISFRFRRNGVALLAALAFLVVPSAMWLYFNLDLFSSVSTVRLLNLIDFFQFYEFAWCA